MGKKLKTIIIVSITLIIIIIGGYFLLSNKTDAIITQRNSNVIIDKQTEEELGGKINQDLEGQELEFEEKIYNYISNIYLGLNMYMPEFKNIDSANEDWIWECASKNLSNFEEFEMARTVTKENVETSAKQLFGNDFNKEFPKEGIEFWLEPEGDKYFRTGASIELDFYNDFEILSYKKNGSVITVNIIEYKSGGTGQRDLLCLRGP